MSPGTTGVHAATYVKRFGSKKQLTLALTRRWADSIPAVATTQQEPLTELRSWVLDSYGQFAVPHRAIAQVVALAQDMADPDIRQVVAGAWARQHAYVAALLSAATERGELPTAPGAALAAQLLLSAAEGSVVRWSARPDHSLVEHLEMLLDAILDPWRRQP